MLMNPVLGRHALQVELGREYVAAEFHHRAGNPLQQRRAATVTVAPSRYADPEGIVASPGEPRTAAGLATLELFEHRRRRRDSRALVDDVDDTVTTVNSNTTTRAA